MATLVAIDPDTKFSGIAVFRDGLLVSARALSLDQCRQLISHGDKFVIETPQTYGGRASKGDANDLIALGIVVGRFVEIAHNLNADCRCVYPRQWKGQVPKEVMTLRVWRALSADEKATVYIGDRAEFALRKGLGLKSGAATDVLDAVGIGLWALKRLK